MQTIKPVQTRPLLDEEDTKQTSSPRIRPPNRPNLTRIGAAADSHERQQIAQSCFARSAGSASITKQVSDLHQRLLHLEGCAERLHQGIEELHSGLTEAHAWIKEIRKIPRVDENRDVECTGDHCAEETSRPDPFKTGITVGLIFAGWHVLWTLLILISWAQPVIDFVFWAHMIQPVYVVRPFNPLAAITLLLVTFSTGYVLGHIGAALWNHLRSK